MTRFKEGQNIQSTDKFIRSGISFPGVLAKVVEDTPWVMYIAVDKRGIDPDLLASCEAEDGDYVYFTVFPLGWDDL